MTSGRHRSFGELLRRYRIAAGLTQEGLAEAAGVSARSISDMERGLGHTPRRDTLIMLADALSLSDQERALFETAARGQDPPPATLGRASVTGPHSNLPAEPNALIGRLHELAQLCDMIRRPDVRLITLTGPGGVGKTRLALQAAARLLGDFADGVFFVNLAPITDPKLVVSTIAQTLGLRETGAQPLADALREYLAGKRLLLLLDNFEQVVGASSAVGRLLSEAPGVKALATSREALRLRSEREFRVPPLKLPDARQLPPLESLTHYETVQLFIDRAVAVQADFQVTNHNAPAVAEICFRLDGLPLAIELAAARVKILSPQAMLARLENRLKLLTGGPRDLPERQQTLRNAIEWSYDLLSAEEQKLFRRLAVFVGGRSLEAVEAVCNGEDDLRIDVLEGVGSLVSQSLLQQREGSGGEPRFWMLETIHEYAREKLQESGEAEELGREHARYFMASAEEAEPHLRGKEQAAWLGRLEEEHDNIRAALRWAREEGESGDNEAAEIGLRIAGALGRLWMVRGYLSEGREQLKKALSAGQSSARVRVNTRTRAKVLNGAGSLAERQGDYRAAQALHEESLALMRELGDKRGIALSLGNLGIVAQHRGDYGAARFLLEETLVLMRELGDKWGIANSLGSLGGVAHYQGDYAAAEALYEESLTLKRELGDKRGIAILLNNLGIVAQHQGDYRTARSLYEESLALGRELGNKQGIAISLVSLGHVAIVEGDARGAGQLYRESLAIARELGDKERIAVCLAGLGRLAAVLGDEERGARLLGACEALLEGMGAVLDPEDRMMHERGVAAARAQLGEEAFSKACAEGRAMSMEQAIAYALENA